MAETDIVVRLHGKILALRAALKECADELEAEIEAHYKGLLVYPVMQRKRARDLEIIDRARKLLGE